MSGTVRTPPRPTRARGRRWRRALALLAVGTLLAIAAAELALRALGDWLHPPIYLLDDRLGWRHAKDVDRELSDETGRPVRFVTDARGLRDDHVAAAPVGARRVLFVGDSFTDGSQVEVGELFSARVAALLGDVVAHNAGVGGYSTVQELLALDTWLAELHPDLVVLAIYANDFVDNLMPFFGGLGPRPHLVVGGDAVELVPACDPSCFAPFLQPAPAAWWLYGHSAIYRSVHKNLFLKVHGDELWRREQDLRDAVPVADQRVAMADALARMSTAARAGGASLLVAAIPTRAEALANDAPTHAWLAERCRALDLPFVSLLDALHRAPADTAYFAKDIHFTVRGHEVAAQALAPAVRAELARRR